MQSWKLGEDQIKKCSVCKEFNGLTDFVKDKRCKDGRVNLFDGKTTWPKARIELGVINEVAGK